ncbi:MAG: glycosyltransferase 87 family protein [Thermoleophilaceae bacterium]
MSRARTVLTALAVLAVALLSVRASAGMAAGLDYFQDAGTAIDALARGDLQGFFANQPLMGSFSLLLRAPFVAAVFDQSLDTVYYVGALPCVAATLVLGVVLGRLAADRGQPPAVQGIVAGLAVINPLTFRALHWGHPEELLAAALCVGAVIAALRERSLLAGLLLGLALATKQWAVLAILPALLAAPRQRLALAAIAGAIAAALTLPALLLNADQFSGVATAAAGQSGGATSTTPWNVWWPFAELQTVPRLGTRWMSPAWVPALSHPLIVAAGVVLPLLLWRRRTRRPDDALLLLALLFLLRCMLDNWDNVYYHVPFLLSLLAWESVRRPGVPAITLAVTLLISASFWERLTWIFPGSAPDAPWLFALYMAWTLPLAAALALVLYRPEAVLRQYHRRRGSSTGPAAVRHRAGPGGDRGLGRQSA